MIGRKFAFHEMLYPSALISGCTICAYAMVSSPGNVNLTTCRPLPLTRKTLPTPVTHAHPRLRKLTLSYINTPDAQESE